MNNSIILAAATRSPDDGRRHSSRRTSLRRPTEDAAGGRRPRRGRRRARPRATTLVIQPRLPEQPRGADHQHRQEHQVTGEIAHCGSICAPMVWATPSTIPPSSVPHSDPRPPMTTASNAKISCVGPMNGSKAERIAGTPRPAPPSRPRSRWPARRRPGVDAHQLERCPGRARWPASPAQTGALQEQVPGRRARRRRQSRGISGPSPRRYSIVDVPADVSSRARVTASGRRRRRSAAARSGSRSPARTW